MRDDTMVVTSLNILNQAEYIDFHRDRVYISINHHINLTKRDEQRVLIS